MLQSSVMEFKNVVFNAARDGKLRRLKVGCCTIVRWVVLEWAWVVSHVNMLSDIERLNCCLSSESRKFCSFVLFLSDCTI